MSLTKSRLLCYNPFMRQKNIKRAAHGLYLTQADDKNKLLSKLCTTPEAKELVQDQGRALVILEKLVLPQGTDSYDEDEMAAILLKKLKKKGHRIQDDEEEDDEQYAEEKEKWAAARLEKVPTLFGKSIKDEKDEKDKTPKQAAVTITKVRYPTPWYSPVFYFNIVKFYLRGQR